MLLLTGATGSVGSRLLPLLLEQGEDVRCLVREPRRLGASRVDVQLAIGAPLISTRTAAMRSLSIDRSP